jgi:peptidylprolyl isomerase
LQYIEVQAGDGPKPQVGEVVAVHYTGMLDDGTVFDDSYQRGEPIRFPLGVGQVIPGWDEGIALMNKGGKARLIIPPDLAYGDQGAGNAIPPGATLTFDVELVDIQ